MKIRWKTPAPSPWVISSPPQGDFFRDGYNIEKTTTLWCELEDLKRGNYIQRTKSDNEIFYSYIINPLQDLCPTATVQFTLFGGSFMKIKDEGKTQIQMTKEYDYDAFFASHKTVWMHQCLVHEHEYRLLILEE
jgi:hypothetical protein